MGYTIPLRVRKCAVKSIATCEIFFSSSAYQQIPTSARIPVCDLADRKFLAFSKPPAANTMKVNNTSSKISDVGFEWISANLDQISLYVPNFALVGLSIFFFLYYRPVNLCKTCSMDVWKEKTLYYVLTCKQRIPSAGLGSSFLINGLVWMNSHGLESRSERRFKTWFGPFLIWKPDFSPCEHKAISKSGFWNTFWNAKKGCFGSWYALKAWF